MQKCTFLALNLCPALKTRYNRGSLLVLQGSAAADFVTPGTAFHHCPQGRQAVRRDHWGEWLIYDIAVIGGGIVGLATALALVRRGVTSLIVLEAADDIAAHQSGHNSGVIHSGLYYKPGSLKARLCIEGREELYAFCAEHGIRHDRCGKLVVATRPEELPRLEALAMRGRANGLAVAATAAHRTLPLRTPCAGPGRSLGARNRHRGLPGSRRSL